MLRVCAGRKELLRLAVRTHLNYPALVCHASTPVRALPHICLLVQVLALSREQTESLHALRQQLKEQVNPWMCACIL